MKRYLTGVPRKALPEGARLVHNFFPGPPDDPGRDRGIGSMGFRIWMTDEPNPNESRCYCGWPDGREHYGTIMWIDAQGNVHDRRPD